MPKLLPLFLISLSALAQNQVSPERAAGMKADLMGQIDAMKKPVQVMVDSVFSFGELGFQEVETSRYLTSILEKEGFKIERGVAGIPTAFVATWGQGKPLNIAAALAVKKVMEREQLQGTIKLWPGVAEEQLATKAYYVRAGLFKDVDIVLFT